MGKALIILLGLSLLIERVTEKILYLLPAGRKRPYAWAASTIFGLLIAFGFKFGFIRELGLAAASPVAAWADYAISGFLIAAGSEPIHSLVDALAFKRDELKRKAKSV